MKKAYESKHLIRRFLQWTASVGMLLLVAVSFPLSAKAEDAEGLEILTDASAAAAAAMLREGESSASVDYWDTAQQNASSLNRMKKATMAMLVCTTGGGPAPVGRDGIRFQPSLEVPLMQEGEDLQRKLDFNILGSIYTDSPLVSVTASFESLGEADGVTETVTFEPATNVRGYSLDNSSLPLEEDSLNNLFDISKLSAGRYRFTLSAVTVDQPEPVTLRQIECAIVSTERLLLTQNKFDSNYFEASSFFGGETDKFLFHYAIKDDRNIGTENDWRETYIVESSLGRVHSEAVPYFELANYYLNNTYVSVTMVSPKTGKVTKGRVTLLEKLISKHYTYVPRFQSNLQFVSHHTLGTAIDVNDDLYPNKNIITNHELIGDDVKNHLVYNGIMTNEDGISYYDFTYNGSYPAKFSRVPKTIVNYLLYELAFYRAGFQWGFYYETACDAMHFTLSEMDINRHMHSDVGLRKIYEYIDNSVSLDTFKNGAVVTASEG